MTRPSRRRLRLVSDPEETATEHVAAWRVEVWVTTYGNRPWLASSAIVDSERGARLHASQSVSGLVVDGIEQEAIFVGAILGHVPTERAADLDPGWVPNPDEPIAVAVVDDGGRLGLWLDEPPSRWRDRTGMPGPNGGAPHPAGDSS